MRVHVVCGSRHLLAKLSAFTVCAGVLFVLTGLSCPSAVPVLVNDGQTDASGEAVITTDQGTITVETTDSRTGETISDIDIFIGTDGSAYLGLASDPQGRYLPMWFDASADTAGQSGKSNHVSLLSSLKKIGMVIDASFESPDPAVLRTQWFDMTFERFKLLSGGILNRYIYNGSATLGELRDVPRMVAESLVLTTGDILLEGIGVALTGGVSLALTATNIALDVEQVALANIYRKLGYSDDDVFDVYYRVSLLSVTPTVHIVLWPRTEPTPTSGLTGTFQLFSLDAEEVPAEYVLEWTYLLGELWSIHYEWQAPQQGSSAGYNLIIDVQTREEQCFDISNYGEWCLTVASNTTFATNNGLLTSWRWLYGSGSGTDYGSSLDGQVSSDRNEIEGTLTDTYGGQQATSRTARFVRVQ